MVRSTFGDEGRDAALRRGQAVLARAPADPAQLSTRPVDPARRPELLEAGERSFDRLAGYALLPFASEDGAKREQRSGPPVAVAELLVPRERLLQE